MIYLIELRNKSLITSDMAYFLTKFAQQDLITQSFSLSEVKKKLILTTSIYFTQTMRNRALDYAE